MQAPLKHKPLQQSGSLRSPQSTPVGKQIGVAVGSGVLVPYGGLSTASFALAEPEILITAATIGVTYASLMPVLMTVRRVDGAAAD